MATAEVEQIKEALAEVWPRVLEGIDRQKQRGGGNTRRRIVEQTLWELQRAGRLCTPEEREVVEKARDWHESWDGHDPIEDDDDPMEQDVLLYHAVEQLGAA